MSQDMSLFEFQVFSMDPPDIKDPLMGAIYGHNVEWLWEEIYSRGINLSELGAVERYCQETGYDEENIPQDFWDYLVIDEPEYIIGDWERGKDGKYDVSPNCNGCGYAALVGYLGGAPIVHVFWSETVSLVRALCSPCCPGQANLDSGKGNIPAYTLPADLIGGAS